MRIREGVSSRNLRSCWDGSPLRLRRRQAFLCDLPAGSSHLIPKSTRRSQSAFIDFNVSLTPMFHSAPGGECKKEEKTMRQHVRTLVQRSDSHCLPAVLSGGAGCSHDKDAGALAEEYSRHIDENFPSCYPGVRGSYCPGVRDHRLHSRQRSRGKFAVFELKLCIAPPLGAAAELSGRESLLAEAREIVAPGRIDRIRICEILPIERLDISRIRSEQERGFFEHRVQVGRACEGLGIFIHFSALGGFLSPPGPWSESPVAGLSRSRSRSAFCAATHAAISRQFKAPRG